MNIHSHTVHINATPSAICNYELVGYLCVSVTERLYSIDHDNLTVWMICIIHRIDTYNIQPRPMSLGILYTIPWCLNTLTYSSFIVSLSLNLDSLENDVQSSSFLSPWTLTLTLTHWLRLWSLQDHSHNTEIKSGMAFNTEIHFLMSYFNPNPNPTLNEHGRYNHLILPNYPSSFFSVELICRNICNCRSELVVRNSYVSLAHPTVQPIRLLDGNLHLGTHLCETRPISNFIWEKGHEGWSADLIHPGSLAMFFFQATKYKVLVLHISYRKVV